MTDLILLLIVLFSPLLSGLVAYKSESPAVPSIAGVVISFFVSVFLLTQVEETLTYDWVWTYEIRLSLGVDKAALVLIALVNFISLLVLIFSSKYMESDKGKRRYFAFLGFFITSMVGLLMANHFFLLFLFWELVGLASYLLIGFWYDKKEVPQSARTAFMVNRVADASLLAGIILLFSEGISLNLISVSGEWPVLASALLVIGAFGKSAQLPFSGWLVKAMVGPTPVSALIHAATMVAAGVYLLIRISSVLPDEVLSLVAIVGCLTAAYAAVCAIMQHDIKRILAFSTISQLGYMVMGVGVGAAGSSLFHLITHAFFKAGLFLGAASVIHFMHQRRVADSQDMRYMGGLRRDVPWTFRSFLVCGLALAGLPFFSGFLSKDGIILGAWQFATERGAWGYLVADLSIFVALLTAFYVGRMVLLVFFGSSRSKTGDTGVESKIFYIPLLVLALFSTWIVFNPNPLGHSSWVMVFMDVSSLHVEDSIIPFLSILMVLAGLTLAFSFFKPGSKYIANYSEASKNPSKGVELVLEGFGLGRLYAWIGKGALRLASMVDSNDRKMIDPLLHFASVASVVGSKVLNLMDRFLVDGPVNLIAFLSASLGKRMAGLSSRDGQTQIIWLLLIVILILISVVLF